MSDEPERVLARPPALGSLFARAGAGALPLLPRLAGLGGPRRQTLPATALRLDDVAVDRERLARYVRVCGFPLRDTLPVTFPHILAFPLALALMTDPRFPFPAIGLVHVENEITQHRAVDASERLSLRVWAEDLRPHPRGRQFSLRTEVRSGEELLWEETSVNLRKGAPPAASPEEAEEAVPTEPEAAELTQTAVWHLGGDLGRRYGAVAGDLNPIHLHPVTARLFGFPRAIAHGMWTKARCLAALDAELPGALMTNVRFRRPIALPARVGFATSPDGGGFGVRSLSGSETHLDGTFAPL